MAGRITHRPSGRHSCEGLPGTGGLQAGTIWQCDDCQKEYVLVMGAQYNEPYFAWRRLTETNRNGRE